MRILKMRPYRFFWIVSLVLIVSISIAGSAAARTGPAMSGEGAHRHGASAGPAAGETLKSGGGMCPMMSGGMKHDMGAGIEHREFAKPYQSGEAHTEAFDLMGPFHAWIQHLITHGNDFDFTTEQISMIDSMISGHHAFAIRSLGEIRALTVELKHLLRTNPDNIAAAEAALRRIGDQNLKLQMEGVRLYGRILQGLSEGQKHLVMERIGSPFRAPWNDGSRAGGESPGDPSKSPPEGKKPGGHAGHG